MCQAVTRPRTRDLVVFAKEPRSGAVKTRLAAAIGPDAATRLAWAFLDDVLALARAAAADAEAAVCLRHAPDEAPALAAWVASRHPGVRLAPQGPGDLGQRLARALAGGGARVVVGSDAPDLLPGVVARAFDDLAAAPLVFGPTLDGGFYLLGLAPGVAADWLASGIAWSAPRTLEDARAAAATAGFADATLLAAHRDVDEAADLEALVARLARAPLACAPATRRALVGRNSQRRVD